LGELANPHVPVDDRGMRYRRANAAGGTYFFTVNLVDGSRRLLVERIDDLRVSVREVKSRHPFRIVAWVVLPDHLHAVWTLPPQDADFSLRWMLIKAGFSRRVGLAVFVDSSLWPRGRVDGRLVRGAGADHCERRAFRVTAVGRLACTTGTTLL
jgi:REP element-mobilizing transposase RayT